MRYGIALLTVRIFLAQEIPVIRVPVRMVVVPTLVFSKEMRLIPGLQKRDFRVLDNGIPQEVSLDAGDAPVSVVIAIQTNQEVRATVPFISKVGSVMEAHLVGATGRAAVITYGDDIAIRKPFGSGDVGRAFRSISAEGSEARLIDAGMRGIALLKERPRRESRVLLFIGQTTDRGSEAKWTDLEQMAERENISIYALSSSSGSDTVRPASNKDLGWLMAILGRQDAKADPLSPLVAVTGGTEIHFHRQQELEEAIGTMGVELRSAYLLNYYPNSVGAGWHTISVEVSIPGARTYARPGYILSPN